MPGGVHPPLSVIESWDPNYINPPTHGQGIVIMEAVLLGLCYVVVALRVYGRTFQSKNFGIDDALILFNMIPLTGLAVSICLAFEKYGWNRHIWDIPVDMLKDARKDELVIEVTYIFSTTITKLSILFFYLRISGSVSTRFRAVVYGSMVFITLYCAVFTVVAFAQCRPLAAFWSQADPVWLVANDGKWSCTDEGAMIVSAAVVSIVQDFIVCFLPTTLFLRLRIPLRQKLALTGIFGVGFFLCICGVLRLVTIVHIYYFTYDLTWESLDIWIWTGIESHTAIICASIPALHHLARSLAKKGSTTSATVSGSTTKVGSYAKRGAGSSFVEETAQLKPGMMMGEGDIHVLKEVELEYFPNEEPGKQHVTVFDEESVVLPQKAQKSSWLDDRTP